MSNLNLDALTNEGNTAPFTVTLGGRDYQLLGPKDRDARAVLKLIEAMNDGDFGAAIQVLVRDDDIEAFLANDLPIFRLEALSAAYAEHYALDVKSLGESNASSTS